MSKSTRNKNKKKLLKISLLGLASLMAVFVAGYFALFLKASLFVDDFLIIKRHLSERASIDADLKQKNTELIEYCDVTVVGGGAGGTAAAIQSARLGVSTCLIEETDWLGGMLTSAGVSAIDGRPDTPSGIFNEFLQNLKDYYSEQNRLHETGQCAVSYFCFEPSVGNRILKTMADIPRLHIFYNSSVDRVYRTGNLIEGVRFIDSSGNRNIVRSKVTIDATDFGDLMFMGNIPFDLGPDDDGKDLHPGERCLQPLTYVAVLQKRNESSIIPRPPNYNERDHVCTVKNPLCPSSNSLFDLNKLSTYGKLPGNKLMINIPSHSYGNDFHATANHLELHTRDEILQKSKEKTLGYIYFIQNHLGFEKYGLSREFGTEDRLAKIPYIRESRRLRGVERLKLSDVLPSSNGRANVLEDGIAIGDYPIDLHFCEQGTGDIFYALPPYQIPYGVAVPEKVDGFLAAEKNISVSHVVNGTTRLQPVVMSIGQAVGAAAALSVKNNVQPREIDVQELQKHLIEAKSHPFFYKDLPLDHFAYPYVVKLSLGGGVRGYENLTFQPNNPIRKRDFRSLLLNSFSSFGASGEILNRIYGERLLTGTGYIKRDEAVQILSRLASLFPSPSRIGKTSFSDVSLNTTPFYYSIIAAADAGVVNPRQRFFRPKDALTRAEAVALVARTLNVINSE